MLFARRILVFTALAGLVACATGSQLSDTPPDGAFGTEPHGDGGMAMHESGSPDVLPSADVRTSPDSTPPGHDASSHDTGGPAPADTGVDSYVADAMMSLDTGSPGHDSGSPGGGDSGSTPTCPNTALYIGEATVAEMDSPMPVCGSSPLCAPGDCAYKALAPVFPCLCLLIL